ncbi:MAG: hypothetical protein ACPGFA_10240 [Pikeienuella sp.]
MAIGEAGQIIANSPTENQPITVTFSAPIDNAIIVLTGTNNGGNRHSYRITDVQDGNFTFIIEEWEYHDGPHAAFETINDIAIAEGTHELPWAHHSHCPRHAPMPRAHFRKGCAILRLVLRR